MCREREYLQEGTYHTRLFRGPSTNGMKSRMVLAAPGPLLTPPPSDIGGHVLRETTSRGLCGLVCPSRTKSRAPGLFGEDEPTAFNDFSDYAQNTINTSNTITLGTNGRSRAF